MKIVRGKDLEFIPLRHENPSDPRVFKKVLFTKDELTHGKIQVINWAKILAGRAMNMHAHDSMDEIFIILTGRVLVRIDEEEAELEMGDAVFIPTRAKHEMKALGESDVHYISIGLV